MKGINYIALFLICVNSFSCNQEQKTVENNLMPNEDLVIEASERNERLMDTMAIIIDEMMSNGDVDLFEEYFDKKMFGELITKKLPNNRQANEFKTGFLRGMNNGLNNFPQRIQSEIVQGSSYDHVKTNYNKKLKTYTILFRIYSIDTGINYHNYRIGMIDEKPVVTDLYIYLSGEYLSETFERFLLTSLPDNFIDQIIGNYNENDIKILGEIVSFNNQGNIYAAYELFPKLSNEMQNEKFIHVLKSTIAAGLDEQIYMEVLKDFNDAYPDDPATKINMIDYYIMTEDYEKAIANVDLLKASTEDDFLRFLKGSLEYERNNIKEAHAHFDYISETYPDFFDGQTYLLLTTIDQNKFEEAITILETLIDQEYDKDELVAYLKEDAIDGTNVYEPLVTHKLFKAWENK